MTQILQGLSRGIADLTRGLAVSSQQWPQLGMQMEQERNRLEQEKSKQRREAAKNLLDLAIRSNDPIALEAALKGAVEGGVLPEGFLPSPELLQGLRPAPQQMQGVEGVFYSVDPSGKVVPQETPYYKPKEPKAADFLEDATAIAEKLSYDAGKKHIEGRLGRPLRDDELATIRPALMSVAPISDDVEQLYRYLLTIPEAQRRTDIELLGTDTRTKLLARYGPELALPPKGDPITQRKALEVVPVLEAIQSIRPILKTPKIRSKLGPVVGRLHAANRYDTNAQLFQARIKLATQVVGKFLEGGVLRTDFDERKYIAIMPQLTDTPEVADGKLEYVQSLVTSMQKLYSKGGLPGQTVDESGNKVDTITLPDLPWNPADPNTSTEEIRQWMIANPDYEYGQELNEVYRARAALEDLNASPD